MSATLDAPPSRWNRTRCFIVAIGLAAVAGAAYASGLLALGDQPPRPVPGGVGADPNGLAIHTVTFDASNLPIRDLRFLADGVDLADLTFYGFQELKDGQDIWTPKTLYKDPAWQRYTQRSVSPLFTGRLGSCFGQYDTALYVFVHPESRWRVEPEPYVTVRANEACVHAGPDPGCSVRMDSGGSCAAALNFMKFKVTSKQDPSLVKNVCAMNAHMPAEKESAYKAEKLRLAMDIVADAGCHVFVMVGNFNSQLLCSVEGAMDEDEKPMLATSLPEQPALDHILGAFCPAGVCSLTGPRRFADELTQILQLTQLRCFRSGTWGWERATSENDLRALDGLSEVGVPDFMPTARLVEKTAKLGSGSARRCLDGQPTCFASVADDPMSNPSWSDRILHSAAKDVKVDVLKYSRLETPVDFSGQDASASAHSAVAADLAYTFSRKVSG